MIQLCRHLEALENKELDKNLVINLPPGHGKTVISHIFFPAWVWARRPTASFIYCSYNKEILDEPSVRRGDFIASKWYQDRWGETASPKEGNFNKFTIKNNSGGICWAVPIKGAITGKHVDYVFIDDPIKPKDVEAKELLTIEQIYSKTIPTRIAKKKGKIVLIMQRLSEADLAAFLLRSSNFEHLCFPAEYMPGKFTRNSLGIYDFRTEEGQILWPEVYPKEKLQQYKMELGAFDYAAQYQQTPVPADGSVFKQEWFNNFWTTLPEQMQMIQSWDTTLSSSVTSDYVVGQVWGKYEGKYYLLDQIRAKMDFDSTKTAIKTLSAKWPKTYTKYIEMKASGPSVISSLQKEVPGLVGVNVTSKDGNKEQRAIAVTGLFQSGCVLMPDPSKNPWVNDYITELCSFPRGRHDDQVDATSQALFKLYRRSVDGLIEGLKKKLSWS